MLLLTFELQNDASLRGIVVCVALDCIYAGVRIIYYVDLTLFSRFIFSIFVICILILNTRTALL